VIQAKAVLHSIAASLAAQQREQERIRARLTAQRATIEGRLTAQRAYLSRVKAEVKHAVEHMLDLEPGDLVFYADNLRDPSTIHHLGMYIGGGLMIEAPYTGSVVRIRSINRPDYIGAVRPTG
jgi:cell wall-associated NlpC family hydrolase